MCFNRIFQERPIMHASSLFNHLTLRAALAIVLAPWAVAANAQIAADVKACADLKGEPAIQACTRVIDSKDAKVNMANVHFNRGIEWTQAQKFDQAIEDYTAVIKLNPKHREAYNQRGYAYKRKGNSALALADYNEAIKLDPNRAVYYRNRGRTYQDMRDHAKALADFQEAFKRDPNEAGAMDGMAWIMATSSDSKLRNGKRAVELATKACELTKWKNASYIDTLAAAHAEDGNYAEAVRRQEEALLDAEFNKSDGPNARNRLKTYKSKKAVRIKAA
jgi:tetratricopeptide (TPR) repeat protein